MDAQSKTNTSDQLLLRDYHKLVEIGVFEEERTKPQTLIFNMAVSLTAPFNGTADRVDEVLSYDELIYAIDTSLAQQRYNLLEALGETICAHITALPDVANVRLTIEKPDRIKGRLGIVMYRSATGAINPPSSDLPSAEIWPCAPLPDINDCFERAVQNATTAPIICPSIPPSDYSGQYGERRILYALAQAACELAQRWPQLRLSRTMAELRHGLQQQQGQIWLPVDLILAASPAPKITPDAAELMQWLAQQFDSASILNPVADHG